MKAILYFVLLVASLEGYSDKENSQENY